MLWGGADIAALRALYTELEFHRQLGQLDQLSDGEREGSPAKTAVQAVPAVRVYGCVLDIESLEAVVAEARRKAVIGIAVEATGPAATRAEIVGVSLATEAGRGHYIPLAHRYLGCPTQLQWQCVRPRLAPLLADASVTKVGHDLKRCMTLLARVGVTIGGPAFDTMIAAYLLDPEAPNGLNDLAERESASG